MADELRVVVAADNLLTRAGIVAMLEAQSDLAVVGQVTTSAQLAADMALYQPDALLIDLGWQTNNALRCLQALADEQWPVLALLANEDDAALAAAGLLSFNSFGLLLREMDMDSIVQGLYSIVGGLVTFDPALTGSIINATKTVIDPLIDELTPREDEVLQLLAQGLTNKAIAHELGITDHTVKFHVNAIMTKLNAQSRTDAVVRATRAGLIIL